MRVLVVNAGSSSLKLAVMDGDRPVVATTVERWEGAQDLAAIAGFVGRSAPSMPSGTASSTAGHG